jgi:hypothetical protein
MLCYAVSYSCCMLLWLWQSKGLVCVCCGLQLWSLKLGQQWAAYSAAACCCCAEGVNLVGMNVKIHTNFYSCISVHTGPWTLMQLPLSLWAYWHHL